MQQDITKLQEEIDRCKEIIDILLKENRQLQQQIAYHTQNNSEKGNATAHRSTHDRQFRADTADGVADDRQFRADTADGVANDRQFRADTADGAADDRQFRADNADGIANDRQFRADNADGAADDRQFWIDIDVLANLLKKEVPASKLKGLHNMCSILQLFYTKTHHTHKHIAVVAKMSESGVAKNLRMLKKRGLIVRSGFQEYSLTAKALGIINQCIKNKGV